MGDWKDLKWWISGVFGLGTAGMMAFGPDVLPDLGRWIAFATSVALVALSGAMLVTHWWRSRISAPSQPLEIVFDPANPGRRFWSIETAPPLAPDPGAKPRNYWEYRAVIRNASTQTIRNVKVIVEAIGPMATRPEPSYFDIDKQPLRDLAPGEESLVIVRRWPIPIKEVGFLTGDAYGPIKVTALGDGVPAAVKLFRFAYEEAPMLSEIEATAATPEPPSPPDTGSGTPP